MSNRSGTQSHEFAVCRLCVRIVIAAARSTGQPLGRRGVVIMVGRWLIALLGLMAALSPGQVALALPELPPPPPPKTPPPPPTGLRPLVGPDGRVILGPDGKPQFMVDLPQPPVAPMRPTGVPQVLMRHLAAPPSPLPGVGGPGAPPPVALPVPAAGQGLRDVTNQIVTPPPTPTSNQDQPSSTLPQSPPPSSVPLPPPPPSEGGRRPGAPRGF